MAEDKILLTGASGYVGGRLLPVLEKAGCRVRCLARRPESLSARAGDATEVMAGDLLAAEALVPAMEDIHTAYYLVHSMGDGSDFAHSERQAAESFAQAAKDY